MLSFPTLKVAWQVFLGREFHSLAAATEKVPSPAPCHTSTGEKTQEGSPIIMIGTAAQGHMGSCNYASPRTLKALMSKLALCQTQRDSQCRLLRIAGVCSHQQASENSLAAMLWTIQCFQRLFKGISLYNT